MTILHLCPYTLPAVSFGGPAKVVYELAAQQSKNHQVYLASSDAFDDFTRLHRNQQLKNTSSLTILYFPNWLYHKLLTTKFFTHFGLVWWGWKNLRKFDIIHLHDVFVIPQLLLGYLAIWQKKTVILSPHGVLYPIRMSSGPSIKKLLYQVLVAPLLQKVTYILATADETAQHLETLTTKPVAVLHNGIRLPSTSFLQGNQKKSNKKSTALFLGRLHHQKGLMELVRAVKTIIQENRISADEFELILAGPDDGLKNELTKYIANNGLANIIQLAGVVEGSAKEELFAQADFFVYPSHAEGFSISILEALAHGLPVIATTGCNFPEIATQKAGKIVTTDALESELADAIALFVTQPSYRQSLVTGASQLAKKYSIETMANNSLLFYQKALQTV